MMSADEFTSTVAAQLLDTKPAPPLRQIERKGKVSPGGCVTLDGVTARKVGRETKIRLGRRWTSQGRAVAWLSPRGMAIKIGESHASLSKRLQPGRGGGKKDLRRLRIGGKDVVARKFGGRWKLRLDNIIRAEGPKAAPAPSARVAAAEPHDGNVVGGKPSQSWAC